MLLVVVCLSFAMKLGFMSLNCYNTRNGFVKVRSETILLTRFMVMFIY